MTLGVYCADPGRSLDRNAPSVRALCLSGLLHGALIAAAFLSASYFPDRPATLYAQVIAPEEKKIIWYPLQELRRITPTERIGTAPVPQGREKRSQAIVIERPDAQPGKQLLWRSNPAQKIEQEVPAPNMVAVEAPREPAKPRNVFQAPAPAPVIERPPEILPPPPVPAITAAAAPAPKLPGVLAAAPKVTRPFVAPPTPAVHRQNADVMIEPPSIQTGNPRPGTENPYSGALDSVLGKGMPQPPRRQFVPPSATSGSGPPHGPVSPVELGDAPIAGGVNAAVLSTAPLDKILTSIPEGSRPVRMSAAPTQGAPSSGPVKDPQGLQMPGVLVAGGTAPSGGAPKPPPKPSSAPSPVRTIYEENRIAVRRAALSAPLPPSSRIIPQLIDSRFRDRVVYTMIVAKPQVPVYAGDWVLWFAEKQPRPGSSPQMRAPQPMRKVASLEDQPEPSLAGRVQFSATILKNGQVDAIVVLNGAANPLSQAAAIRDLQSWQFAPALRDGEAVDVEVVVEIPFQSNLSTSSTGTTRH